MPKKYYIQSPSARSHCVRRAIEPPRLANWPFALDSRNEERMRANDYLAGLIRECTRRILETSDHLI